jgi:hypothetical protein
MWKQVPMFTTSPAAALVIAQQPWPELRGELPVIAFAFADRFVDLHDFQIFDS